MPTKGETQFSVSGGYRRADNSITSGEVRNSEAREAAEKEEWSLNDPGLLAFFSLVLNPSYTSKGKFKINNTTQIDALGPTLTF